MPRYSKCFPWCFADKKLQKITVYRSEELLILQTEVEQAVASKLTLFISDNAEEFRIEISGKFSSSAASDAAIAWRTALLANTPRRISIDINRMTSYDQAGYSMLREAHAHGTNISAGTPKALRFFSEISSPGALAWPAASESEKRTLSSRVLTMPPRATASGE